MLGSFSNLPRWLRNAGGPDDLVQGIADMMRLLAVVALAAAAHSAPVEKTAAIDDVQAGLADAVSRLQDGLGPVCGSVEACVHGLANGTVVREPATQSPHCLCRSISLNSHRRLPTSSRSTWTVLPGRRCAGSAPWLLRRSTRKRSIWSGSWMPSIRRCSPRNFS